MSAEVQTAFPIASFPDHILVDGNKLFRANDVLEVGASTDVAVVCNEVLSIDVFSKFLNCLRTLQVSNLAIKSRFCIQLYFKKCHRKIMKGDSSSGC